MAAGVFDDEVFPIGFFDVDTAEGGWFDEDLAHDIASVATIPGVGPTGAATFVLDLEAGAQVTFSWQTEVHKTISGLEQRVSMGDAPKQRYKATAFLLDGDERTVRSAMLVAAATGQPFLLALPYEELTLSGDAAGGLVPVWSTTLCDWDNAGQRVVVRSRDHQTIASGVVQSSTGVSVTLDAAPGVAGNAGGSIMPAQAVYLNPTQGIARHPVNVSHWQIDAIAALFGFANVDTMGVGATVTTFDSLPVYTERNDVDDTADNPIYTLGMVIDAGALPIAAGGAAVIDEGRSIIIQSSSPATWQYFKAFLFTVKGRFATFLRPTWQPDLVFDSNPGSATLKIKSNAVAGAGNYLTYFNNSSAQKRLQILKTDGTVQYVIVSAAGDNGDGTITLNLSATVTATVDMISFLETCRLDSDDITIDWGTTVNGYAFGCALLARVVQQSDTQTSKPVELYEFTDTTGVVSYRTSYQHDFSFLDPLHGTTNNYLATPGLKRGQFPIMGSLTNAPEMTVELPMTDALASNYCGAGVPPQNWKVRIIRVQRESGASTDIHNGYVRSCDRRSNTRTAVFTSVSVSASNLEHPVPNIVVSDLCPHTLYDSLCQANRAANTISPTITNINGRFLTISSRGALATDDLAFGDLIHPTSGERRSIIGHSDLVIELNVALPTGGLYPAANGQTIQLAKGCNRTRDRCVSGFSNMVNYAGDPQFPIDTSSRWPHDMKNLPTVIGQGDAPGDRGWGGWKL